MILIQLTGLSGAGKSTLANGVKKRLLQLGLNTEVIDGDEYRKNLFPELGFSPEDRTENIRRIGYISQILLRNNVIVILAVINPYEATRNQIKETCKAVKTVWIDCDLNTLVHRDTKGLYKKALLPEAHPDKLQNLTGVNAPYEAPHHPDLVIHTNQEKREDSENRLFEFILASIKQKNEMLATKSCVQAH